MEEVDIDEIENTEERHETSAQVSNDEIKTFTQLSYVNYKTCSLSS